MNPIRWHKPKWLPRVLAMPIPDPSQHAARILSIQRNIVLPAKLMVVAVLFYYLFFAGWSDVTPHGFVMETLQGFFNFYIIFNAIAAVLLVLRRFPHKLVPWVVFTVGLLDGLLLAGLTIETGGFGSNLFWVFPGLIVVNALSIPLAAPQIVLNLSLCAFYLGAGVLNISLGESDTTIMHTGPLPRGPTKFTSADIINLESFATKLKNPSDPHGFAQYLKEQLSPATRLMLSNYNAGADRALQKALADDVDRIMRERLEIFTEKLKNPSGPVGLSEYLNAELSPPTLNLLSNYHGGADRELQKALADEINRLLQTNSFIEARRLTNFVATPGTTAVIQPLNAAGTNLVRLNRALLSEAFPQELSKTHSIFPTGSSPDFVPSDTGAESFILRLIILLLMTVSCYGVQLLSFRQRISEEEARKSAARNDELRAAGRLAAEIAHQLKNPLGIINNAAFTLQRGLKEGRTDFKPQMEIIREEIERSDRIITQLMGYAQLSEGRVEKLNLPEEIDRAIAEVMPPGGAYEIQINRRYAGNLPGLLMQRTHFSVVLVNILQNAREALNGRGNVSIHARVRGEDSVELTIADDGPGIPPEKLEKVFEAYFTTKDKGTGLGLAIVKHNVELYGGAIWVESELGKGARFILSFPAKTLIKAA